MFLQATNPFSSSVSSIINHEQCLALNIVLPVQTVDFIRFIVVCTVQVIKSAVSDIIFATPFLPPPQKKTNLVGHPAAM